MIKLPQKPIKKAKPPFFPPRFLECEGVTLIGVSHDDINFSRNLSAISAFKNRIMTFDALAFEGRASAVSLRNGRNFESTAKAAFKGQIIHMEENAFLEETLEGSFLSLKEFIIFRSMHLFERDVLRIADLINKKEIYAVIEIFSTMIEHQKFCYNFSLDVPKENLFLAIFNLQTELNSDELVAAYKDIYNSFFDFYARLRDKKIYAPRIIELSKQYKKFGAIVGANHLNRLPDLLKGEAVGSENSPLNWDVYVSSLDPLHQSVYASIMRASETLTSPP